MKHLMRRAVVACVVAGTVAGSLALSAPSAGALVPSPNPPTNLTVYKQGTSTASATALDVLDVSIADDSTPPYLPIDTANGNPRLEFTKSGNRTVYVAVTATGPKAGTAVLPVLPETGLWHVNLLVGDVVDGGMNFTYTAESWTCSVGSPATDGTNKFCEQRFTASGTWTVPTDVTSFDFLVVGGGGGGGGGMTYNYFNPALPGAGAGGGGGEVTVCANQSAVPGNDQWTVTVGSGGAAGALRTGGSASPGADGGASSIVLPAEAQCLAAGGVGGESAGNGAGSGGPSRVVHVVTPLPRGAATPPGGNGGASGNANAGGTGANSQYNSIDRTVAGGGGGGSGAVGSNGSATPVFGGAGGAGTNPSGSFGDLVYTFGGGGGGGAGDDDATDGTGGRGWYGGGNGGSCSSGACNAGYEASDAGNAPEANSGGGGGGGTGSSNGTAAAGAAGIVIVRWAAPQTATLYVHQTNTIGGGSCASPDFATIAGAIAAAVTGDTIVVCSGTYQEGALVVPGSITELTIKGEVYPALANPTVFPAVGPQAGAPVLDGRDATTPSDDSLRVRILDAPDTFLHLENLTLQYGSSPEETTATAGGGGVRAKQVSLDHTSFTQNEATRCADGGCGDYLDRGGAVLAVDAAPANTAEAPTVDIDSSNFDANSASLAGGAVASSGYVLVNGSAFDGNSVSNSGIFAHGGAISTGATDNGGSLVSAAPVTAISSSFTNNSIVKEIGESASIGSAIAAGQFNGLAEDILLINSTVAGNTAEAGYAITLYGSNVFVRFSTVVNNTLTGVEKAVFAATSSTVIGGSLFTRDGGEIPCEVATTYVDLGYNITDVSTCTPDATTQVVADVAAMKLGTLGEQGTSGTKSYPLEADSPAVDFADCDLDGALTVALDVDQNGTNRPQGANCDAGAVERVSATGSVWIERNGAPVTTGDSCETPPYTSITAAVAAAQADDIIHVCSGTYREAEINVTVDNLTILGEEYPAGSGNETIINGELTDGDATTRHRIVDARGLAITFDNVTLQNGVAAASSDYGSYGGAVYAYQVTVLDSEMKDNDAAGGGAVFVSADGYVPPCGPVAGLTESNAGCAPVEPAVTVGPSVTVTRSTFDGNGDAATTIIGGAIYAMGGTVTAVESTFDGNKALARTSPTPADTDGAGGAIQADSVSVFGSTFTNNAAYLHGGAISASAVSVAASTDGQASLFSLNSADGDGDIDTVDNGYGGAIWADAVEVADTTFANNSADFGGAIASAAQPPDSGPVTPGVPTSSSVSISRSLFESNSATVDGGGVFNLADPGSTTLENVTLTLNSAGNAGGGVYAQSTLTVNFTTFTDNTSLISGGTFWTPVAPAAENNIFVFAAADETQAMQNGCLTYNWEPSPNTNNYTTNYWCPGNVVADVADLDLQALADNGGLTETIALGENSVAIDTVDTISCNPESSDTDQRGVARPIGDTCDAGAFEYFGDLDLGDGGQDPGVVHTLEVPDGVSTVYALLVGGGGPGGNSNDDQATGGGGGGEVKECAVDVLAGDVVTYRIGDGGTDGDWGGSSWVAVNYVYDPFTFDPTDPAIKCYAAGGRNGKSASGDPRANGGASGNSNLGGAGMCPEPCVAGGGGGGAGSVGTPGLEEPVRGGAGGAGVSPSAAFGDISTVFGGGGGGGATGYGCAAVTAGAGGAGGGGAGAEESLCDSGAPVSPGSYAGTDSADGTDGTGGGGGGAGGSYGPGEGGSGTAMFRTPVVPEPEGEPIYVCLSKTYVVYGARYFEPKVYYCVEDEEGTPPESPETPEDQVETPTDGFSTVVGDDVVDTGVVSELVESEEDEGIWVDGPAPLHYDHIPDGWRKVNPEDYPDTTPPTCTTEYEPGDGVAESGMEISCTGGDPGEGSVFDYSLLSAGLQIYPARLTVKPRHLRVPYGTPEPSPYEFTVKGFKLGETADDADGFVAPDCDSDYDPATASAGDRFDITCENGAATNYTFRYKSSHIHVDKQRVNLRPADVTITYGDSVPSVVWSVSGLRGPESALAPDRLAGFVAPTCTTDFDITDGAGEYDIDCEGASSTNFEFVAEPATLTVNKATLTVVPSSASVTYGSSPAQVGFVLSGFVNGETLPGSGYQAPRCLAPSYTSTTPAGSLLTVECTGGSSRNYMFDVSSKAVLAVTKAPLVVVPDSKSAVYGSSAPVYTFRTTGWRNGESPLTNPAGLVMPVCGSSYAPTDNAGSISSIVCTGGSADNYDFDTQATGTVTVAKAVLTVVADSQSTTYAQAAPALTATVSGFVNGEGPATAAGFAAPSCTSAYVVGANAGNYPITCSGGTSANYAFSYVSGSLSVAKVVLRAVPGNASVVYGTSSHPSVPLTVSGFVAGQTVSTASGYRAPSCSLAGYTSATTAGTHTITCSGGTAANYTFDTSATSTLTVTKAPATITATSRTVTYGSATPSWAFTVSGLRNGQTATTVAGMVAPVCSSGYSALSNAGTIAPISCSGASSTNYNFTYVAGKATVTKAVLTVTANSLTITKGSAVPAYTNVITGWQNGQGPATAAGYVRPICKSSYSTRSAIGNYTISCSGGSATNYIFTYRSGVLSVR